MAVSLLPLWATVASAASLKPVGSFEQPLYVASDPEDPERLFVVERDGRVVEVNEGETTVFADLTGLVSCCEKERGLHSIALAPDFPASGRFTGGYSVRDPSLGDLYGRYVYGDLCIGQILRVRPARHHAFFARL